MADNSAERRLSCSTCFEMYPPSFYIRYTPEEQKKIYERDKVRLRKMLEEMEKQENESECANQYTDNQDMISV
jgi:SpoVK/Ycf46/Vps4 family AAA+-type ATPase